MKQSLPPQPAVPGNEAEGEGMFSVKHSGFPGAQPAPEQEWELLSDCTRLCWQMLLPGSGECMGTSLLGVFCSIPAEKGAGRGLGGTSWTEQL